MPDLTVCGAGVFGLSVAWVALQRGATVRVVDPNGAGSGASGGIVGALQPHTPDQWNEKKQFQLDSLLVSQSYWQGIQATSGIPTGYRRCGRLQPIQTERGIALARARTGDAEQNWQHNANWQVIDQNGIKGWFPPSPTNLYISDDLSAILNPRQAVQSLAAALRARGVDIDPGAPDKTGATVWATGWEGLMDLSRQLNQPVGNGVKGQAALLNNDASNQPQLFADGLHIIGHTDGTTAIGSTSEREFTNPTETDQQVDDLITRATEMIPALKGARVLARWAGVRPRATSRAPLLGPHPTDKDHFIANGGFKIGFGIAPKVAETMCDLILEGKDQIPASFHTSTLASSV